MKRDATKAPTKASINQLKAAIKAKNNSIRASSFASLPRSPSGGTRKVKMGKGKTTRKNRTH